MMLGGTNAAIVLAAAISAATNSGQADPAGAPSAARQVSARCMRFVAVRAVKDQEGGLGPMRNSINAFLTAQRVVPTSQACIGFRDIRRLYVKKNVSGHQEDAEMTSAIERLPVLGRV